MIKHKPLRIIAAVLAAAVVCTALSAIICSVCVKTTRYSVTLDGITAPLRLVLLSDLHCKSYGRDNSRLFAKIRAQSPDVIFMAGDMIDRKTDDDDVESLCRLIETLCADAPVFFALGNHEKDYIETDDAFLTKVEEAGAVVVDDSYADVTIGTQPLRIGGTMGHAFYFGRSEEEFTSSAEYLFLKEFENTDTPTICLAHMPDTFIFNGAYKLWNVDLVLSGHTHGGLIRLPFVGGLYAPMQEWFPEYDCGYFRLGDHMQMVISAGLAGHDTIPRINNLPEIVVIDLVSER